MLFSDASVMKIYRVSFHLKQSLLFIWSVSDLYLHDSWSPNITPPLAFFKAGRVRFLISTALFVREQNPSQKSPHSAVFPLQVTKWNWVTCPLLNRNQQRPTGYHALTYLFQLLEATCIPWLMVPPSIIRASTVASSFVTLTFSNPSLLHSLTRTLVNTLGPRKKSRWYPYH